MRNRSWWMVAVVATWVALLVPVQAGTPAMDVTETDWVGAATVTVRVTGQGKTTEQYLCEVFFGDGYLYVRIDEMPTTMAEAAPGSWTQKGKRIKVELTDPYMEGLVEDVFEEMLDLGSVDEVLAVHGGARAKLRTKDGTLTYKMKVRGKLEAKDGKTYKVRMKLKAKGMESSDE